MGKGWVGNLCILNENPVGGRDKVWEEKESLG